MPSGVYRDGTNCREPASRSRRNASAIGKWLVVGDGCADDTGRLVQSWAKKDGRISWLNLQEHTGHPSRPRNAALAEACGTYQTFWMTITLWDQTSCTY